MVKVFLVAVSSFDESKSPILQYWSCPCPSRVTKMLREKRSREVRTEVGKNGEKTERGEPTFPFSNLKER
jgi:hypothetical protein